MANPEKIVNKLVGNVLAALAVAVTVFALPVSANHITPPAVPSTLQVPTGFKPFLVGHAVGTQNYVCLPSTTAASGYAWTLFTPEATLFDDDGKQLTTHYFSPNPIEPNSFRPTWLHSRDSSTVWMKLGALPSFDSNYVAPGAIPWLLLQVAGKADGPEAGDDALSGTAYIHRVNTVGGVAPSTGCASLSDVGQARYVPYLADYYFYSAN